MQSEPIRRAPAEPLEIRVKRLRDAAACYARCGAPIMAAHFLDMADEFERAARPEPAPDGGTAA
jgi:hypothetical protein